MGDLSRHLFLLWSLSLDDLVFPKYLSGILDLLRLTPTYRTLFQVACQTIEFGRGVCGKAADSGETQLVQVGQIQSTVAVMILTGTSYSFLNAECS